VHAHLLLSILEWEHFLLEFGHFFQKYFQKSRKRTDARQTFWEHRHPITAWVRKNKMIYAIFEVFFLLIVFLLTFHSFEDASENYELVLIQEIKEENPLMDQLEPFL